MTSAAAAIAADDRVLPFQVDALGVRGRLARLGPAIDEVILGHGYPEPVSRLLGEAVVLGVLLGSALKFDGRFILQTQTDGPVGMLVVDYESPEKVRGCARFDAARVAAAADASPAALLGRGHLAMTIDQGPDMNRYQGVVELEGQGLEAAAHRYFRQSEQIPTLVRLAVGQALTPAAGGARAGWRAGGLLLQYLPADAAGASHRDLPPGDAPPGHTVAETEDDAWTEARMLASTVEDHELIDPALAPDALLWRLFNRRGVRVFQDLPVTTLCRCSRDSVLSMLRRFDDDDRAHMVENGRVTVTCEFCSKSFIFAPNEIGVTAAERPEPN